MLDVVSTVDFECGEWTVGAGAGRALRLSRPQRTRGNTYDVTKPMTDDRSRGALHLSALQRCATLAESGVTHRAVIQRDRSADHPKSRHRHRIGKPSRRPHLS